MAVPDTTTFTLQDVVTEVNPTTDDLVDCFADAVASKFDSTYSGSKNSLLNFRNYGAVTIQQFYLTVNTPKSTLACNGTANNVAYHNGTSNSVAALGDTIYSNLSGTIPYPAGTYGQTLSSGGVIGSRIVVDSFGVVTAFYIC